MNSSFENEITKLQSDLFAKIEEEKKTQLRHQKEVIAVHSYFESRWAHEMKKLEITKLNNLKKQKLNMKFYLRRNLTRLKKNVQR